jgi:hypothetical protein
VYFNCEILRLLKGVSEVNPSVNLLVGLLKPPTKQECIANKLLTPTGEPITSKLRAHSSIPAAGGVFSGLATHPLGAGASSGKNGKG